MREDMDKVIVERARSGGTGRVRSEWSKIASWRLLRAEGREDESPTREKIQQRWSDTKGLSEHLQPLVRWVRSNVGRPWDKVHSEIASRLDRGNTVQRHVLEHLERDIVRKDVIEQEDGTITDVRGHALRSHFTVNELLYVCPRTGLLRRKLLETRRWTREAPRVDVTTPYHRIAGVWFEVGFAPTVDRTTWDVMFKEVARPGWGATRHWKDGGTLHARTKRQLSSREIRRLGLR